MHYLFAFNGMIFNSHGDNHNPPKSVGHWPCAYNIITHLSAYSFVFWPANYFCF